MATATYDIGELKRRMQGALQVLKQELSGLRTGRWLKFNSLPHNNLLVSILNLFGDTRQTFGAPQYCTGPLTGLT